MFFVHYLPALEEALRHDHEWEGFLVKGPDYYYYTGGDQLYQDLETFIATHGEEIPLFDRVGVYFDCLSHGHDAIDGVRAEDYKALIRQEAAAWKLKFGVD